MAVDGFDRGYRAESVLSMLRRSARLEVPDRRVAAAVLRSGRGRDRGGSWRRGVAWANALPLDFFDEGGSDVRDRRRSAGRATASGRRPRTQVGQPDVFLDARSADRRRPRLRSARQAQRPAGLHRQRSVRPQPSGRRRSAGASRCGRPGRRRRKPSVREIVGVARQVKGRPDEIEGLRAALRADGAGPLRRHLPGRPAGVRPRGGAGAVGPRGDLPRRQGAAGQRARHQDARRHRVDSDRAHRFRAVLVVAFAALALVLAMVGVFGILAYSVQQHVRDFGVRRALGATTHDILRLVMVQRRARHRHRRGDRTGAVGRVRPADREDAVRRPAAGSGDVCARDGCAGHHRRACDRRPRLAGGPNRSGVALRNA